LVGYGPLKIHCANIINLIICIAQMIIIVKVIIHGIDIIVKVIIHGIDIIVKVITWYYCKVSIVYLIKVDNSISNQTFPRIIESIINSSIPSECLRHRPHRH